MTQPAPRLYYVPVIGGAFFTTIGALGLSPAQVEALVTRSDPVLADFVNDTANQMLRRLEITEPAGNC